VTPCPSRKKRRGKWIKIDKNTCPPGGEKKAKKRGGKVSRPTEPGGTEEGKTKDAEKGKKVGINRPRRWFSGKRIHGPTTRKQKKGGKTSKGGGNNRGYRCPQPATSRARSPKGKKKRGGPAANNPRPVERKKAVVSKRKMETN